MNKVTLGPQTLLYPTPALLIGAIVEGKPNFMTAAWAGIANSEPPMISVAINRRRYTLKGIQQNFTFSVNIPSVEQARETDYCGMFSGAKDDKVKTCNFRLFYGKLGKTPLIEQCPVNLECRVAHMLNLGSHFLIIGAIEETHVSESCLTDGKPDVKKIRPLIYTVSPAMSYHALGEVVAKGYSIGKELGKAIKN